MRLAVDTELAIFGAGSCAAAAQAPKGAPSPVHSAPGPDAAACVFEAHCDAAGPLGDSGRVAGRGAGASAPAAVGPPRAALTC